MRAKTLLTRLLLIAVLGCNGNSMGAELKAPSGDAFSVLFIGNSLTYWNTLPAIVAAMADSAKVAPLVWGMVAFPDHNLEDHWNRGEARQAIALGNWDVVVLQQGPSSLPENRANLITWARRFDAETRRIGGRTGLYSVWPAANRPGDFTAASTSYRLAADSVGGVFMPAADAWRLAVQRDTDLRLYSEDGLHPNINGSYIAALVIFERLYHRSPVGLPASLQLKISGTPVLRIDPGDAATMQAAAAAATR